MVLEEPHRALMTSNVLYLGNSECERGATGIAALKEPLKQSYPVHESDVIQGIDAFLTIYTSGIQLQLGSSPAVYWFPIQNLYLAAAMKCVSKFDGNGRLISSKFVELNEPESQQSSHAPLFAFINKPTSQGRVLCHAFMTKNNDTALSLVEAARTAYMNDSGHANEAIPVEVAKKEFVDDASDTSSMIGGPRIQVININDSLNDDVNLFPRELVKEFRLERMRPRQQNSLQRPQPSPMTDQLPSYRSQPNTAYSTYRQTTQSQSQHKRKVITHPPIYVRAPPPKVIREPPRIIQTPPQIFRQPIYIPVEKIVDRPYPYPVRAPTPPPQIIQAEPEIIEVPVRAPTPEPERVEVPVYIEGPTQYIREPPEIIEVPVPMRSPTPPPEIIRVPVYIEAPPQIIREPPEIREVQVPVPYEVQLPPPPPEIREVYIEGPPVYIPGPKEVEVMEVPVPYPVPYEVPIHTAIEVPHFFPVPVKGKKEKRFRDSQIYDPRVYGYHHHMGHFYPGHHQQEHRRQRGRRHRSTSSSSSSSSDEEEQRRTYQRDYPYHLSNDMHGMRITEVDDDGRPLRREPSPRRGKSPRRGRGDSPRRQEEGRRGGYRSEDIEGYDFYRPIPERSRREKKEQKNREREDYYMKARYSRNNYKDNETDEADHLRERTTSPPFSDTRLGRQMPAHLSDSISELPQQRRSRNHLY